MQPHTTDCPSGAAMRQPSAPPWEVADILRLYGATYRRTHPVSPAHQRVMHDIEACRTAQLGGHAEHCPACGFERYAYNSCRNRHCPKCQTFTRAQWVEDRKAELLPVPYFHLVFTLPHALNPLILAHKRPLLTLLFNAASQTLIQFGHRNLGGQIGCTMVLHTWDQTLGAHFHVHCVIAAGALASDGGHWIDAEPRFLFPVRALSNVFRGKFCAALAQAGSTGALPLAEGPTTLGTSESVEQLRAQLYAKEWVVYAKAPFAGPAHVLDYVGRYTHRVAIANHRLLDVRDGWVRFAYRNRRQGDRVQTMMLDADEFIRRFLLHVLPRGFMRIRHYGFLANRHKARSLRRCRDLLGQPTDPPRRSPKSVGQWMQEVTGIDLTQCPHCGTRPLVRLPLSPLLTPPACRGASVEVLICDSS
ncbi:MAG TPA: IS91 family transposase [Candidatus Tectomicrobia bacterium]